MGLAPVTLSTLVALVGCQSESGEYPKRWTFSADERVWESEHFIYHSYPDDDATCPEVLNILEDHFRKSQEYLGFPWPEGAKIDYYKFPDPDALDASRSCESPVALAACAYDSLVFSVDRAHSHELVHVYFLTGGQSQLSFLHEGLAEASTCRTPSAFPDPLPPWREVVEQNRHESGAWLVAYLLSRYPASQFVEWFRATRRGTSADEVGALFEGAYGFPLDDAWEELPVVKGERFPCPLALECTGVALPLDGTRAGLSFCGEANSYRSFQVDEPTTLILRTDRPIGSVNGIVQCVWPGWRSMGLLDRGWKRGNSSLVTNLEPGIYGLGVELYEMGLESRPVTDDAPLYREEVSFVQGYVFPRPILAPSCPEAVPFAWSDTPFDRVYATWTIPPGDVGDVQYARLIPGSGYQILLDQNVSEVTITLCDGCEGACIPAEDHNSMFPDAEGVVTLRFERVRSGGEVAPSIAWLPIEQ